MITIEPASLRDLDEIVVLRDKYTKRGDLKPLSVDYISYRIREFFLALMYGEVVGCFRIFHPEAYPNYLELGSVVSKYEGKGVGASIVQYAGQVAIEKNRMIIAITNGNLDSVLKKLSWAEEDRGILLERMKEAPEDKKLWTFNKKNM